MGLPNYIIIGECKCGTTSLYQYLIQHPYILETYGNSEVPHLGTKEIRFFDRCWAKGLDWYKSCFPETKDGQITGEGSPEYFFRTTALERIYQSVPNAKFILMLRNPADRLYSHFHHLKRWIPGWTNKYESFRSFLDSAREEDYFIIKKGMYADSLRKWFEVFPREQFVIVRTEDFSVQTQEVYSTVLSFLGMENRRLLDTKFYRLSSNPPMSSEIRQELLNLYRPYNQELYDLISHNMQWRK